MTAWLGVLIVATAWFMHLTISYFLAWADCATLQAGLLTSRHIVTVAGIGVTVVVCSIAHHNAARSGAIYNGQRARSEQATEQKFMARLTIALSLMFLFAVVLAGAANLFLAPCV